MSWWNIVERQVKQGGSGELSFFGGAGVIVDIGDTESRALTTEISWACAGTDSLEWSHQT